MGWLSLSLPLFFSECFKWENLFKFLIFLYLSRNEIGRKAMIVVIWSHPLMLQPFSSKIHSQQILKHNFWGSLFQFIGQSSQQNFRPLGCTIWQSPHTQYWSQQRKPIKHSIHLCLCNRKKKRNNGKCLMPFENLCNCYNVNSICTNANIWAPT